MKKNDRRFECVYAGPDMMNKGPVFRSAEYPKNYQQDVAAPDEQGKVICPDCGKANPAGTKYCSECGMPMFRPDMSKLEPPSPEGVYAGPPIPMQMPTYMGPQVPDGRMMGCAPAPVPAPVVEDDPEPIDVYMGPPIPEDDDCHV